MIGVGWGREKSVEITQNDRLVVSRQRVAAIRIDANREDFLGRIGPRCVVIVSSSINPTLSFHPLLDFPRREVRSSFVLFPRSSLLSFLFFFYFQMPFRFFSLVSTLLSPARVLYARIHSMFPIKGLVHFASAVRCDSEPRMRRSRTF